MAGKQRFRDFVTRSMSRLHRKQGYRFMGMNVLFLTTIGRRTGEKRETPVSWYPDGEDAWLIVASAGGAARNPGWYRNLAADPEHVWIELPDRTLQVRGERLDGPAREDAWRRITAAQPRYAKYQAKTARELPVIRLTPYPNVNT
jgi:deazaflavin-dependent oxidoreductase (nitroreductase family)